MTRDVAIVILVLFLFVAWLACFSYLLEGARRTTSGKHWWLHMNTLDPLIHPGHWPPEARAFWKRHLVWFGVFLATGGAVVLARWQGLIE